MSDIQNKIIKIKDDFYKKMTFLIATTLIVSAFLAFYFGKMYHFYMETAKILTLVLAHFLFYTGPDTDFKKTGTKYSVLYIIFVTTTIVINVSKTPNIICYIFTLPIFFLFFFKFKKVIFFTSASILLTCVVFFIFQEMTQLNESLNSIGDSTYYKVANFWVLLNSTLIFILLIYYYTIVCMNKSLLHYMVSDELENIDDFDSFGEEFLYEDIDNIEDEEASEQIKLFQKIEDYMKNERPWLDPEYNLNKLAKDINSNTMYVSTAINANSKKNFKTYINDYRLDHFMVQVEERKKEKASFKDIYLKVGFSSQSTFNRAFKSKYGKSTNDYLSQN